MPATRYKIWGWGSKVGQGATVSEHIGVSGIAKKASANLPFTIANELICMSLARAVMLPIPPGFIVEKDDVPYYVSMNFNLAGEDLPPADARKIVTNHGSMAWGIILFDIWVANSDRHKRNIAYDEAGDKIQIFDHSHAFFHDANDPKAKLEGLSDDLGIGEKHILAQQVTTLDGMPEWVDKFGAIPRFYIEEVIRSAVGVGLPQESVQACTEFLCERKDRLRELVENNLEQFPNLNVIDGQDLLAEGATGGTEK